MTLGEMERTNAFSHSFRHRIITLSLTINTGTLCSLTHYFIMMHP